jgi:Uma2 family endonuclease
MSTTTDIESPPTFNSHSRRGEPTWEIAMLYPRQGEWTEEEYLALDTNRLIELTDGCLEFLTMPSYFHQWVLQFLFKLLDAHVAAHALGTVFLAPFPVQLWTGKIREPDIVYLRPERYRNRPRLPRGADLAMEIVSDSAEDRKRDLVTKREEYAQAGIAEYWIIDPRERRITVLVLKGITYQVHGEFTPGMQATSVVLPGLAVDVAAVFAAGEGPQEAAANNQTK